ncbi:hypothetical protein MMC11_008631 [Xylographa trunciseda]|nr:hypothetical protein [Xylographa trunciseda]
MSMNTMRHQHPPPYLSYPMHSPYNGMPRAFVPDPPTNDLEETRQERNLQEALRYGALQKTPQYALPLCSPPPALYSSSFLGPRSSGVVSSEHMLRRKTPNGTLAAGYDGTPVEWTTKPHAHKHLLMPMSDNRRTVDQHNPAFPIVAESSNTSFSSRSQSREVPGYQSWNKGTISPHERYGLGLALDGDLGTNQWRQNGLPTPSLDSVLHQTPLPHPIYNMGGYHQVPMVLQPMWPPCLGPTASNAPGPYGPYWPNGSFEPYRPAALRDQRFHTQFANFSISDPSDPQPSQEHRANWSSGSNLNPHRQDSTGHGQWTIKDHRDRAFDAPYPLHESSGFQTQDLDLLRHKAEQNQPPALSYTDRPIPTRHPTLVDDPSDLTSLLSPVQSLSPLSPSGSQHSDQLQFKEKVLVWAHRIYINLLASIHQSRKHGHNKHHNSERRQSLASIFPRPPQGSSSISSSTGSVSTRELQGLSEKYQENGNAGLSLQEFKLLQVKTNPKLPDNTDFQWPYAKMNTGHAEHHMRGSRVTGVPQAQAYSLYSESHQSPGYAVPSFSTDSHPHRPTTDAKAALEMLARLSRESGWKWIDGMLLGGCLAYGLGDYDKALHWYAKVLAVDTNNVEAISNMAATLLSLNRRKEAEQYWLRSVKLRPSYFEAVEHLVGLLCGDQRGREAIKIIDFVASALRTTDKPEDPHWADRSEDIQESSRVSNNLAHGIPNSETTSTIPNSSGYRIPEADNGRLIALIHAKGNMLYALGNNTGAAKAFEDAIMIGAGGRPEGIGGLIKQILRVFARETFSLKDVHDDPGNYDSVLLLPEVALKTAKLVFPHHGELPGLRGVPEGQAKKAAISTTSNSLLSLAKIYQDGMSTTGASTSCPKAASGVHDILALYYLSLSLQPSPSTANNVGILLASVQQTAPSKHLARLKSPQIPNIPGVMPGSGIGLALAYYNYGLNLDSRHAHLYTNLGSLLKDIGQLSAAIKMYEQAVACDGNFDIALANLANAVKDQGRISDAIGYYKRAVNSNPDFAEAVCGLANALNSVCSWQGRGGIVFDNSKKDRWHVDEQGMLLDAKLPYTNSTGWIARVVAIVDKQLSDGHSWGIGILKSIDTEELMTQSLVTGDSERQDQRDSYALVTALSNWAGSSWEGAKVVRLVERATKRLGWQLYQDKYVKRRACSSVSYARPQLPSTLAIPSAPTVLPFHTFTCPLTAKQIRKISQRNGLRISCSTLRSPWLPTKIFDPPAPPSKHLNVGYVSSDFNNHPLAHLMQSVFGFHNPARVKAFCYATTVSDGSSHREQIEQEAPMFYDASTWSLDRLVKQILDDGIHILINLNGYTRGARNEVFAARPAPIQMSFMGFAGTLGAEWCDYLLADTTAIPPQTLRPWRRNVDVTDQIKDENHSDEQEDWVYGENIIYTRDTFFCCDHRQSAPDSQEGQLSWSEEQRRRWKMRKELFPELPDDTVILGNFNQLYKIEPTTFRTWLRILSRIPKSILWLLRFPDLGENNLRQTALLWAGAEVASRIIFTDVAPKHQHISRARVCDLFLDTPECNAHTTAADVLWSGTPLLTFPRYEYKMCSRMAASILKGALPKNAEGEKAATELVVASDEEYETRAVELGSGLAAALQKRERRGSLSCRLTELRKILYEARWTSALFDTRRWVRDLEDAYEEAWRRWVAGEGGDIWL